MILSQPFIPMLSVVIIGRNEGERLLRCIRSVQSVPQVAMEIIYVDSASSDDSVVQAQALGVRVLTVQPERPAAAIGRNAGWQAAQAELILFLDGDTLLQSEFISIALPHFATPTVGAVCGHRREMTPKASIYQQVLDLEWIQPTGGTCGGDVIIRRKILEEIGGYNPDLIAGEDPEICQRILARGYTVLHLDVAMTLHDLAILRWSQYWRRSVRTGHAYAEVSQLLKNTATPLWKKESQKNFIHISILTLIFMTGIVLTGVWQSPLPILGSVSLFLLLSLRSAWRARWRSQEITPLLLYGLHSQFQHLPIAVGQWSFYFNRWRGQRRTLIEYK